jgi:hypothetical protein
MNVVVQKIERADPDAVAVLGECNLTRVGCGMHLGSQPAGARFSRLHCSFAHATCGAARSIARCRNSFGGPKALKAKFA